MGDIENSSVAAPPRRVVGRPFEKGVSGNPGGRPKKDRALTAALERVVSKTVLAEKVWEAALAGDTAMQRYIYDRIDGSPVQRHEAKLQSQVDETARILAERYGMSVAEVQARARALAAGT